MSPFNRLELHRQTRPGELLPSGARKTERHFLDFVVDGISLWQPALAEMNDCISCLWLPSPDPTAVGRLLGDLPPDLPQDRCAVYGCSECNDPGCGVISVRLEVQRDRVIWHDFCHQYSYMPNEVWPLDAFAPLQPLVFELSAYRALLTSALAPT